MRLLILLMVLLLSGCDTLPIQDKKSVLPSIKEVARQAEQLSQQKKYGEAKGLLTRAKAYYPSSKQLPKLLKKIIKQQKNYDQLIEDQLLVVRFTQIQQQHALLTQLAKSKAVDLEIRSRLQALEEEQLTSRPLLSVCGERQLEIAQAVAEKCLHLALAIAEQETDRKRFNQIKNLRKKTAAQTKQKQGQAEIQQLLKRVYDKRLAGERYEALTLLEQVLALEPKQASAIMLQKEITAELKTDTLRLLTVGERLYQKGQLEEAIAAWKALLVLNPQHKQALRKTERARRVMDNLRQLRQQQKSVPSNSK